MQVREGRACRKERGGGGRWPGATAASTTTSLPRSWPLACTHPATQPQAGAAPRPLCLRPGFWKQRLRWEFLCRRFVKEVLPGEPSREVGGGGEKSKRRVRPQARLWARRGLRLRDLGRVTSAWARGWALALPPPPPHRPRSWEQDGRRADTPSQAGRAGGGGGGNQEQSPSCSPVRPEGCVSCGFGGTQYAAE